MLLIRHILPALTVFLALALSACSDSTSEVLAKARNVETSRELMEEIGHPDEVKRLHGNIYIWTYHTDDGKVTFRVSAGKVSLTGATRNVD